MQSVIDLVRLLLLLLDIYYYHYYFALNAEKYKNAFESYLIHG